MATAKQRIRHFIQTYRRNFGAMVKAQGGLCAGQAVVIEFRDRQPECIVHMGSTILIQRYARRIAPEVGKAFARAIHLSKPGQAPAICLYMRAPGDVAAAIMVVDLKVRQNEPK